MTASTENQPQPQAGVMTISPYKPGESSLAAPSGLKTLQLAANEGALGPSPKAQAAIAAVATDLHRYPDGGGTALKQKLGETFGLPVENLMLGAGSDELISLLISAYAGEGDEVLYSQHGFLMYKVSTLAASATPVAAPEANLRASVQSLLGHVTERTRLVFLANPNNPTGSYLTKDELHALHAGLPSNVMLVIDGAYTEFAGAVPDYSDGSELVAAGHKNVAVLRTFSKIFGLAALRVGWGYAHADVIDVIDRVRSPFNVSAVAQAAAIAALEDKEHFQANVDLVADVLPWFTAEMEALGLEVPPSLGNFVLVKLGAERMDRMEAHLKEKAILCRRVDAYGLPDYIRISMSTREDMERVVSVIKAAVRS